jgi:signal transduction histidine kinase
MIYRIKHTIQNLLYITLLFYASHPVFTQSTSHILKLPDDSSKVAMIFDLAWQMEVEQPDSAIKLYTYAGEVSKKIGYELGIGRAIQYTGIVLSDQGRFDESMEYYKDAIRLFERIGYKKGIAATLINMGNIHQLKAEYVEATNNYLDGIKLFEQISDTLNLIYSYTNLGGIFSDVEQFDKSLSYYRLAFNLSKAIGDSSNFAEYYIDVGTVELKRDNLDSARTCFEKAKKYTGFNRENYQYYLIYNGLSEIDTKQGENLEALEKSKIGLQYSQILGSPSLIANSMSRLGMIFNELNQRDSAEFYLKQAIRMAHDHEANEVLLNAYNWMAVIQEDMGNDGSALQWFKKYITIRDSVAGERQQRIISGLEIRYETEKKDLMLSEKNLEIQRNEALLARRTAFIIALSGALLSAFVFLILIRRSLHQKRIIAEKDAALQREKVNQLQQEKQLITLQSMMEGQEQERRRLARDLHDGLGGLLSSVKHRFSNIQGKHTDLVESREYQEAIQLLDNTSSEARKIAHNLMPEALVKFGLKDALEDFCHNVGEVQKFHIDLQFYGMEERLQSNLEISIYRIVQELMNNIIKHANASEVIVQLVKNEDMVHLTVEDDGVGFNPSRIRRDSAGLNNIRSRVKYLRGNLEMETAPGKGTTYTIVIPNGKKSILAYKSAV